MKNKKALPVLPSKKKKIVSEPVNFYGSSLQNNPYTTEIDRKTTGLNEILSPSVLKQQKKTLSKHGDAKRFNPGKSVFQSKCARRIVESFHIFYSKTSMAQTLMASLPGLFRTCL